MRKIIDVQIGEVKVVRGKVILNSKAIGSCVAIAAYDRERKTGALAHVMLPGRAPQGKEGEEKTKYAADAIDLIIEEMGKFGSRKENIEVVLVGGGNVLNREDDTICKENIESVEGLLNERGLKVRAKSVGGTSRRSIYMDVEHGVVSYTKGDDSEMHLWRAL